MDTDRNGLEVLPREECLRLLGRARIGRVALSLNALPAILPVNFTLLGNIILFRTNPGAKLDAALANNVVAFEADGIDPVYQTGWSVLVQGVASEVVDAEERVEARRAPVRAWAGNGRDRFVRIATEYVSGRRIPPPAADRSTVMVPGENSTSIASPSGSTRARPVPVIADVGYPIL